ncbi:tRNA pseudouridine(38-40) synthase TruA [Zhihengliuella sp.]|uniref:tRNA pseudouridine(38-40) synthase TruA n=1 Tax=Zhihengliuella sp. TaxID=1954483 RepID=UPI002811EF9A|nr:tRNA pseudouridine(38-40) synthase TruA [Zhihengliuella sp.]
MPDTDPLAEAGLTIAGDGAAQAPALTRIRLRLAYDGADFSGWARQPHLPTVQGSLEDALAVLIRRPVRVTVAGRTDAGVHARGQVVHFDLAEAEVAALARGYDIDPMHSLLRRLRGVLGRDGHQILVHEAALAAPGFDARFSALARRYSYRIADGPERWDPLTRRITLWHRDLLDVDAMNREAASVLGRYDFLTFCKPREGATTIRTLHEFAFTRGSGGVITARLVADAFCHNMVRALIGATLKVGDGREAPGWLAARLAEQTRDSKTVLAAPHPLVLEEVLYPEDAELAARAEQTRARRAADDVVPGPSTGASP